MGKRWRSSKVFRAVVAVLAVLTWAVVGAAAAIAFERAVTVPYCETACRAASDELHKYRSYTRGGPPAACVCHNGEEIRTGFWRDPVGLTITTFAVLPVLLLHIFSAKLGARTSADRRPDPQAGSSRRH